MKKQKVLKNIADNSDVRVWLVKRKIFMKGFPDIKASDFYGIVQESRCSRQEIYLRPVEMIKLLQAVMSDFGQKMPTGMKVITKIAEIGL